MGQGRSGGGTRTDKLLTGPGVHSLTAAYPQVYGDQSRTQHAVLFLVLFCEASLCPSDKDKHMCNVLKTDSMAKHFAVGRGHSTHFKDEETEAQRD